MKRSERTRRMVVILDEDAYLLLEGLTSPRRKGTYLGDLIRRAAAEQAAKQAVEHSEEHSEEAQLLQSIEERLERIEEKLDEVGGQFSQQASRPQAGREAKE